LETDSAGVVEEISEMLQSLGDRTVKWARRLANEAAHKLSQEGYGLAGLVE
jgi:hypothetical protein